MSLTQVEIINGPPAHAILRDLRFLGFWRTLYGKCPHATAYQDPSFVCAWYETYRSLWQPVIVTSGISGGELVGLWLLAYNPATNTLAHAGTHQSEYHAWLALPGEDVPFLSAAWVSLKRRFIFTILQFKYLPAGALGDLLLKVPGMSKGVTVRKFTRPLLKLDVDDVNASFKKKSNKSRFGRIRKLGDLEFRRITDIPEFEGVFDDLIAYYDFRQGAVNHASPFREDPLKRDFHSLLFASTPGVTHLTVTFLENRPIAALWGFLTGNTLHLGLFVHSPFLAEHSPGKLHMMLLCQHLLKEGREILDLTPGGDPWKERFSNEHDEVAEVLVYRTAWALRLAGVPDAVVRTGKNILNRMGITPADLRSAMISLKQMRPKVWMLKIGNWANFERELRVYRSDRSFSQDHSSDFRVRCNSLSDLLSFLPSGESPPTRDAFLSTALTRLEKGERACSVSIEHILVSCAWMLFNQTEFFMTEVQQKITLPPCSAALYDFFIHPDPHGHGFYRKMIGQMVREAFATENIQYAYIFLPEDNPPSWRIPEDMGFKYLGSYHRKRRFGRERRWSTPSIAQSEATDA